MVVFKSLFVSTYPGYLKEIFFFRNSSYSSRWYRKLIWPILAIFWRAVSETILMREKSFLHDFFVLSTSLWKKNSSPAIKGICKIQDI